MFDSIVTVMDIVILTLTSYAYRDALTAAALVKEGTDGMTHAVFRAECALRNGVYSHLYASTAIVVIVVTFKAIS
eukprot:GSChrysophyteH1.ASY1.ANO1.591.1 assembled CDS